MTQYNEFLKKKHIRATSNGFNSDKSKMCDMAFEWQKDVVVWALKKGKSALFEDCGLGKTLQQLMWAKEVYEHTNGNVLILAPLAVAAQTKREGDKFNISVNICRTQKDVKSGINITNYEMLEHFEPEAFKGIVLDESSILKHHDSKTRAALTESFNDTPYKLCCTATPSPNDYVELGNHSEFLGIMSRTEMLATFFVHDGGDTSSWRLKGHAVDKFFEWVASWACCITNPSELGYIQDGYDLPPLEIIEHIIESDEIIKADGQLSFIGSAVQTLSERRNARRDSLYKRCEQAATIANNSNGQTLVWCDLNDESRTLTELIDNAVEVKGADKPEHKTNSMMGFKTGEVKCLVSKPMIAGWGMNWQNCNEMIFVGLSDSFEMYYQAIRRCWRFGQINPVKVHIVISSAEGAVKSNLERKQKEAENMQKELIKHTKKILTGEIKKTERITESYYPTESIVIPGWLSA